MYRRYRPWHYAEKLHKIVEAIPDAAVGADVMVGFPGESDSLFEETYRFIEDQPFTYLHLFSFSARPGTAAWALHKQEPVHGEAVKERMARLRALIDDKHRGFKERFVGRPLSVVTLRTDEKATRTTRAISDNFLSFELDGSLAPNLVLQVRATGVMDAGLYGSVMQPEAHEH